MCKKTKRQNWLWITWERQRRSIELADHFGCELLLLEYSGKSRYPKCVWETCVNLIKKRPNVLFVQNPSMFLATLACLYGKIFSACVVVDRHTTFLLTKKYKNTPPILLFKLLHRFTIRFADLTIVTNQFLADIVHELGGRPFILPDKLPSLVAHEKTQLKGKKNVLLISSFGIDEPVEEVLAAMSTENMKDINLYISGNHNRLGSLLLDSAPDNVIFTGFLSEQDFIDLLFSVDVVMTLTTARYCMLCGCYEAVAALKPLITSKQKELEEYFTGAFFVDNSRGEISAGITQILSNYNKYIEQISTLHELLNKSWETQYQKLDNLLEQTLNHPKI